MDYGTQRRVQEGLCAMCYSKASDKCAKCKLRYYCSSRCQFKDWHLGHKGDCGLTDIPAAPAPDPPPRMLPESVELPVVPDGAWRRLVESSEVGPKSAPARGLRNLGNTCYMNSVLQGLHHAAPQLVQSCREHCSRRACNERCFRCDLSFVSSECLEPVPARRCDGTSPAPEGDPDLGLGDRVELVGLQASELNGREGIITQLPSASMGKQDARYGVRLSRESGTKMIKVDNIALRCQAALGPERITRWLPVLGSEFTFGAQEDAHEFMRSLLRLVEDEELKEHAQALRDRCKTDAGSEADVPRPEVNADLTATPARLFGGLLASQCRCTNRACLASSYTFENFQDLALDISEVTDSLDDALRLFTAPERLDKQNAYKCESCGETVRARKQLSIFSAPSTLVFQLKRFRPGERGKVNRAVSFPVSFNLRPYLSAGSPDASTVPLYSLRAVVVHVDRAGYSHFGHYVAFVRCTVPERKGESIWYLLDDSNAVEVSETDVLQQQAYLLFYARDGTPGMEGPPALRRGLSSIGRSGTCDLATSASGEEAAAKCRGRNGAVCSFYARSDGLCTRCYQEEHGRPPPEDLPTAPTPGVSGRASTAVAATGSPASAPAPEVPAAAAPPKAAAKPATKTAVAAAAPLGGGKPKKLGPNDQCPCGSGKKYKKCHGAGS